MLCNFDFCIFIFNIIQIVDAFRPISYTEGHMSDKNNSVKIVCLGGGIGTVQLIKGLRGYSNEITVVASMADDGGSGGRLRRLFSVPPPGDLINCIAALSDAEPTLKEMLTYRFEGDRWGRDDSLGGQKLGNLMLVALTKITGNFNTALTEAERLFACQGKILPATVENVSIWAKTNDGQKILGEETIDLGKYEGDRTLSEVHLEPSDAKAPPEVVHAIAEADLIIAGPGDLYTTILPVLLVPDIKSALKTSSAKKVFIINTANKPFETKHYRVSDYIKAIASHLNTFPFEYCIVNSNTSHAIPSKLQYEYVTIDTDNIEEKVRIINDDIVNEEYPLYHDSDKLAGVLKKLL